MKLLFIQGGTRLKRDEYGNFYTDGNLNNKVWSRYRKYCDELIVVLREEEKIYSFQEAKRRFNDIDISNNIRLCRVADLMRPKMRFFNLFQRRKVAKRINEAVSGCDGAIIRSAHNFYTLSAVKACKKYKKPFCIEVAGYAFDGYWYHGDLFGKIMAIPYEILARRAVRSASYCLYVTDETLQKRYVCKGIVAGCSDVEIKKPTNNDYRDRKARNSKSINRIIIGTIGGIDVKLKGQKDVIKAMGVLKKAGQLNIEYQLVGLGSEKYIKKIAKKYGVEENVKVLGGMQHDKIFEWLRTIDVYIQPSHTEGLCRSIIEAMSVSCPVISSDAGGNVELTRINYKKKNIRQLVKILQSINADLLKKEAKYSYEKAKQFDPEFLQNKRDLFYKDFIKKISEV